MSNRNKIQYREQYVHEPLKQPTFEGRIGIVYTRVSSKKQESEGSGLQSQETRCIKELGRLGVDYEKTFYDSFTGAGDFMRRPAMCKLLEYIDNNPSKDYVVIFDDLKRLDRDPEFHFKLKAEFYRRGVLLKCLNYNFDESEMGQFMELVMVGYGSLERKLNRRQVIQKQTARLTNGYWAFGRRKGYTMEKLGSHPGKVPVPNREGLEMLKPALEGFANGTLIRKIDVCRFLLEKGFWKTQRAEKYLDKITVIMKDPYYAGCIEYVKPPLWNISRRPGKHEPIISIETFELIQKRLRKTDLNQRIRLDNSPEFPHRGLIVCAHCKGHLTASWFKGRREKYRRYLCRTLGCPYRNKAIHAEDVEKGFDELLKKGVLKKHVYTLLKKMFDRVWNDEIKSIKKQQQDSEQQKRALEKKLSDLIDLRRGAMGSPTLQRAYDRQIEETQTAIETFGGNPMTFIDTSVPYQTALEKASMLLKMPHIAWKKLEVHEQHAAYFFLFQEKLPYSLEKGYQTAQIPYAARLFEDFITETTHLVEMPGVKPGSKTNSLSNCSQD